MKAIIAIVVWELNDKFENLNCYINNRVYLESKNQHRVNMYFSFCSETINIL